MSVLVVGGGGREHALIWALRRDDPGVPLFAAPGNPGTALLATNLDIPATDVAGLGAAVRRYGFDLVIVGPEAPLAAGLADHLRADGVPVFGPSAAAARLESSKAFAKEVMIAAGVRTARSRTFTDLAQAKQYVEQQPERLVVKASGLAAGKGVIVAAARAESIAAVDAMLGQGKLGAAGREVIVEEFLTGEELSVLALTDGEQILVLPGAQDHKRLGEGDTGPNTGGMGAYCPVSLATPALLARVRKEVLEPTLAEMRRRGTPYSGTLYAGMMISPQGELFVLEFNCRFGDPETQVVLPVLPPGSTSHLREIATGGWRPQTGTLNPTRAAVTTVLAARGYPDAPEKGAVITVPENLGGDILLFHAGTTRDADGTLRVGGGRVLNVTACADTVAAAAAASRAAAERITFAGKTWRRDIAWRETRRAGAA